MIYLPSCYLVHMNSFLQQNTKICLNKRSVHYISLHELTINNYSAAFTFINTFSKSKVAFVNIRVYSHYVTHTVPEYV